MGLLWEFIYTKKGNLHRCPIRQLADTPEVVYVLFMMIAPFDRNKIPHKSGVYLFKDSAGKVLYVGKAIDLSSRVSSYFSKYQLNPKTINLIEKIKSCETIIVESELEALILEANLIKKYLPIFNVRLIDDKDYLYIKVTRENYPKILIARKKDLMDAKKYFGPFPSGTIVKNTLKKLRRVFPWCSNPPKKLTSKEVVLRARPCFYYHLELCPGPCMKQISQKKYNKIINRFIQFMDGQKDELVNELTSEMEQATKNLEFERAQSIKGMRDGLEYLTQPNRTHLYLTNPNFLEEERQNALEDLQKQLKLEHLPDRIEAYDISNIQGVNATGSMVILTDGEIDKSQYRKFKIRLSGRPNDVAMMTEMLKRRLKHGEWRNPDLILIDGGRGQVKAVNLELETWNLKIPVYGLAKRMEWLYPPSGEIIKLKKSSLSLRLLQKIRDEAHRFAVSYHRKLRNKMLLPVV